MINLKNPHTFYATIITYNKTKTQKFLINNNKYR